MQGIDRQTGQNIIGVAWLEQQITDILTTPKMSRTMRADYGSNLHKFLTMTFQLKSSLKLIKHSKY